MKLNSVHVAVLFLLLAWMVSNPGLLFGQVAATDTPHWGNGIDCLSCHVRYQSPEVQVTNFKGNSNSCMSCHNPAGVASNMPFSNAVRAVPGVSGSSHAWDVLANNAAHGARPPVEAEMAKRVYDGNIVCSTCHNQHLQTFPPFLRSSNFQNALCKDCHAIRDVGSFRDSPENKGSHPVGIPYPTSDARFFAAPRNPNLPLVDPDRVECTTCHSPHYADSGGANEGAGDGYILRAANDNALCKACHTYEDHVGQGCRSCHQPHDPDRTNIFLIKETVATASRGSQSVVFVGESGPNSFADGDETFDGICEVCHTATNHHRNNGTAPGDFDDSGNYVGHFNGQKCIDCHSHSDSFLPGGVAVPPPHNAFDCAVCHVTPDTFVPNAQIPNTACQTCHSEGVLKTHFSDHIDPATGNPANLNCVECHNPMSVQTNFRGNENLKFVRTTVRDNAVAFEAVTGKYSFAYDLPDRPADMKTENYVCNTCHSQTNHHRFAGTAPGGQEHFDGSDCRQCHTHRDGFQPSGVEVPPPHNAFDCAVCHVTPDTFVPDAQIPNAACQSCHGEGTPETAEGGSDTKVDRHFSDHFIDPTTGQLADLTCVECHNPMSTQRNFRGNNNLSFIRSTVRGGSIAFEAKTGKYSFAYDLPDRPADMSTENYVCNTCHTQTNYHQADGTAVISQTHNDGLDCTVCHSHSEGFVPVVGAHRQAKTDCSNCHLNRETQEPDLLGVHNNDCQRCHRVDFSSTIIGPIGTWNGECGECHNPNVQETGNLATPTKGHRCIVCHGEQRSTSNIADTHRKHADNANCVVCHGFIPDTGTEIGSGSRAICNVCHEGGRNASVERIHEKHVPMGLSCLECHNDERPPV
ncbi:MAG: cytochrome c3 family protein, partial [Candidatus Zixiibacteriota bacterium]